MPVIEENQLSDLVNEYERFLRGAQARSDNTVRIYHTDLWPFRQFLQQEGLVLSKVGREEVRRYLAWLAVAARGREGGYARISVARKLVVLRSFYRFLTSRGLVKTNPVPRGRNFRVKVERRLPTFLGQQEMQSMLEAPDQSKPTGMRDRAILELLYSSGVRLGELTALNIKDVDPVKREVRVRGKGAKERIVLMGQPAGGALQDYLTTARPALAKTREEAMFVNRYGGRLSRRSVQKMVVHYAIKAGTHSGVHTHTLRHTFATHLLEGGANLRVVQELLGHSNPTTTQIYTHVTQTEARRVYMASHPMAHKE